MKEAIRLCALVPYPVNTTPSQRFRLEQWQQEWTGNGVAVEFVPFVDAALMEILHTPGRLLAKSTALARAFLRRLGQMASARRYHAVVIHRAACLAGPALVERAIAMLGCPMIFDFDDAIYRLHTSGANRWFGWCKFPGKTAAICRLSNHVVVGNVHLAEYASRYNTRVTVIPSSVDTRRYLPAQQKSQNDRVVVGWTGSSTSQTYLEMFAPALAELTSRFDVELRVHSNRTPELPGVPSVWRPWRAETEVEELQQFDIGIMPMPDDSWAKGKCAMKALLYMAMGIPAVCSAVGTNCEVIQHGENGLLAVTPEDWLEHLGALIRDPALRQRLGAAGRRTVEEKYSMRVCAEKFANVVRETVGR